MMVEWLPRESLSTHRGRAPPVVEQFLTSKQMDFRALRRSSQALSEKEQRNSLSRALVTVIENSSELPWTILNQDPDLLSIFTRPDLEYWLHLIDENMPLSPRYRVWHKGVLSTAMQSLFVIDATGEPRRHLAPRSRKVFKVKKTVHKFELRSKLGNHNPQSSNTSLTVILFWQWHRKGTDYYYLWQERFHTVDYCPRH